MLTENDRGTSPAHVADRDPPGRLVVWCSGLALSPGSNSSEANDEFIDYTKTRPEDVAHDVDLVLDTVGGPDSSRLLPTLKRGGALYPVFAAEYDPQETAKLGVTTSGTQVRSNGPQLAELGRLLDTGTLRVALDSTFPLADARKAHERAARGHIQGKIVLTVA